MVNILQKIKDFKEKYFKTEHLQKVREFDYKSFATTASYGRTLALIGIIIVVIALPVTIVVLQQQTQTQQHASSSCLTTCTQSCTATCNNTCTNKYNQCMATCDENNPRPLCYTNCANQQQSCKNSCSPTCSAQCTLKCAFATPPPPTATPPPLQCNSGNNTYCWNGSTCPNNSKPVNGDYIGCGHFALCCNGKPPGITPTPVPKKCIAAGGQCMAGLNGCPSNQKPITGTANDCSYPTYCCSVPKHNYQCVGSGLNTASPNNGYSDLNDYSSNFRTVLYCAANEYCDSTKTGVNQNPPCVKISSCQCNNPAVNNSFSCNNGTIQRSCSNTEYCDPSKKVDTTSPNPQWPCTSRFNNTSNYKTCGPQNNGICYFWHNGGRSFTTDTKQACTDAGCSAGLDNCNAIEGPGSVNLKDTGSTCSNIAGNWASSRCCSISTVNKTALLPTPAPNSIFCYSNTDATKIGLCYYWKDNNNRGKEVTTNLNEICTNSGCSSHLPNCPQIAGAGSVGLNDGFDGASGNENNSECLSRSQPFASAECCSIPGISTATANITPAPSATDNNGGGTGGGGCDPATQSCPTQPPACTPGQSTAFTMTIKLPGIGTGQFDNNAPKHPKRNGTIAVKDQSGNLIQGSSHDFGHLFNFTNGKFGGENVNLAKKLTCGNTYHVEIKLPGYVTIKKNITYGSTNQTIDITESDIIPGDIVGNGTSNTLTPDSKLAGDDIVDISDYNIFRQCHDNPGATYQFSNNTQQVTLSCPDLINLFDFPDGGVGTDQNGISEFADNYNLWLRGFLKFNGKQ